MTIIFEERLSDSPYLESVTQGYTVDAGSTVRPAEICWHMVFARFQGEIRALVVGPWTTSGKAIWGADAEILWVKFKPGTFMPHLPTKEFLDSETVLPDASSQSFWLQGASWQVPTYDNVETFIKRLAHDDILVRDSIVNTALQNRVSDLAPRTIRHRFLRSTGLTQNHIRQFERAQQAAALLQAGASILDTVDATGYYDQPHLTRSLKHFIGHTPAEIARSAQPQLTPE